MSLDGISIMNNLITTTPVQPMMEAIQEVEVQTGTYSAQYGSYLGVHINMITKSGTNQIHGSLVEFLSNQVLDARNFLHSADARQPDRGQAASAPEPVRRRSRRAGDHSRKSTTARTRPSSWHRTEGYRLVQPATSLSTEMPAVFFHRQFLQRSDRQHHRRRDQGSAERQRSFPGQHHPDVAHLAGRSQASAILSGNGPAGPGQQLLGARADHHHYRPDRRSHRSEHRRQSPLVCARRLSETSTSSAATRFRPTPAPRPSPTPITRSATRTPSRPTW